MAELTLQVEMELPLMQEQAHCRMLADDLKEAALPLTIGCGNCTLIVEVIDHGGLAVPAIIGEGMCSLCYKGLEQFLGKSYH